MRMHPGLLLARRSLSSAWPRLFSLTHASRGENPSEMSDLTYEALRLDTKTALLAAVSAVKPAALVQRCLQRDGKSFKINGQEITLKRPCHVIGFGKAVLEMALTVERILGDMMKTGVISVPVGTISASVIPLETRIEILEGAANNLPDEMAERNALKTLKLSEGLSCDDTLLVLISGGGSALLPLPLPPVTLNEKLQAIKKLANAGADIFQLNCLRKRLSRVKGGGLAASAHPAKVISLILSDVIGDPLHVIASGPTVLNTDSPSAAWQVVCDFQLEDDIPVSVRETLQAEPFIKRFSESNVTNVLIGNNTIALSEAVSVMNSNGYAAVMLSSSIQGNVSDVAEFYTQLASEICNIINECTSKTSLHNFLNNSFLCDQLPPNASDIIFNAIKNAPEKKGVCILSGGETTVKVTGKGIGGRNQELALQFAEKWSKLQSKFQNLKVALMSAGTDGIDGPTDAAGAFGYADQIKSKPDYNHYLSNNDSYSFYSALNFGDDLIKIGHTGTNVMDIHFLLVCKS